MVLSTVLFSLFTLLCELGDVDAVKVVGSEGTVALGALPLPGVVTHLQTFVAENVETLGEHRLLVSCVAAGAAQLGLETHKYIIYMGQILACQHCYYLNTFYDNAANT